MKLYRMLLCIVLLIQTGKCQLLHPDYYSFHPQATCPVNTDSFTKNIVILSLCVTAGYVMNTAIATSIWKKCLDIPTLGACNSEPDCASDGTRCVPKDSL
ncbi:uncharacterized protein LOC134712671 isoform X2 [Mytilus trossulus]